MPEVFSHTTPLQYLHRLGRLEWLRDFYGRVVAPAAVVAERGIHGSVAVRCTATGNSPEMNMQTRNPIHWIAIFAMSAASVGGAWGGNRIEGAKVEAATGLKGTLNEAEGVFKVTAPRTDVKINVDGWQMPPFMGLTSWAAFMPGKNAEAMVMGDLVLFQDEVNPVMSAALDAGLDVTALHNHFFYEDPKVYFMHIAGEGTVEKLGGAVKAALGKAKEIRVANPVPAKMSGTGFAPAANSITPVPLAAIFSAKATAKDGMAKFVFGRSAKMPCGCAPGSEMGVNTWAAFAGTDDNAVVCGDFCVLEKELQPVLRSLRSGDISIVAIHHHMAMEEPRYLFLHYWGKGPATKLAASLKQALALQDGKK